METEEQNKLLTRVGKATPMGQLLRRYWHPVAASVELRDNWTKPVRLLGEGLVLFKDRQGRLGLIEEHCPHRRASFAYGIPTNDGIRCPYHGWEFSAQGQCLNQPFEKDNCAFRDKVAINGYPVEEMGGLVFAYLGPEPRPLLPRFDGFVVEGAIRTLGRTVLPCNWLQIMENSMDPVHAEWLHGHHFEFLKEDEGTKTPISASHEKIDFREFEYGITKHRLLAGQSEDSEDWKVGHPMVFPNILAVGNADANQRSYAFQMRIPMDDEHTMHLWYHAYVPPAGAIIPAHLLEQMHVHEVPYQDQQGHPIVDFIDGQDMMAWVSQGPIAQRELENLGASDQGVAMYRRMLKREIKKVERGEDPLGIVRDPNRNQRIDLPNEKKKHHFSGGFKTFIKQTHMRYSPVVDDLARVFQP